MNYYSCLELAIEYIKSFPDAFDMVITDFIVGDNVFGGREILDTVRLMRPNCPVILLTGYFQHLESRTNEDQAFSYIAQKPVDFAKISQILSRFSVNEATEVTGNSYNLRDSSKTFDHDY